MKTDYTFTISIGIDAEKMEVIHGENWLKCFKESSDEFCQELQAFIDAHPFVIGCKMNSEESK